MCISCGMEIRTQDRLCMQCCAVDQQSLLVVRGGSWQDQGGNRRGSPVAYHLKLWEEAVAQLLVRMPSF